MTDSLDKPPPVEDLPDWVEGYLSTCVGCTQRDNHPKIQAGPLDGPPVPWHHDCFVHSRQPGWEDFADLVAGAQGATGHALRQHIMNVAGQPAGQGQ